MTRRPRLVTIDVDELRRIVRASTATGCTTTASACAAWPA